MQLDISTPATLHTLAEEVREGIGDLNFSDAVLLWDNLSDLRVDKMGFASNPLTAVDREDIIRLVFARVIPVIEDNELLDLFGIYIRTLLDEKNIDVVDLVRRKLLSMLFIEDRDEYRRKLLSVLNQSNEEIADDGGSLGGRASVGQWLQDYVAKNPKNESLAQAQFFSSLDTVVNPSSQERVRLERLIKLYDYLRLSSSGPGFEEEGVLEMDGKWLTFENGQPILSEPYDAKRYLSLRDEARMRRAFEVFEPGPVELKASDYRSSYPSTLEQDLNLVVNLASQAPGNVAAEQGLAALQRVLGEMRVSEILDETGNESLVSLLKDVLISGLSLKDEVAAGIAGRIVAKLSSEERKIHAREVYYDMSEGKFVWGDPVIIPIE